MKIFGMFVFCLVLLMAPGIARAHSYQQGDIRIGHVWTRATAGSSTTAAIYMPLLNAGKDADRLIGASSDDAEKIEIHESRSEGGIMKMEMQKAIDLEPNKPVALKPRGLHLMVFGLKQPIKEGEKFPVTLQFEKAGSVKVEAMVEAAGAQSSGH
ncbi:MAG: copper chaperone PCu(A)C [Bdellovibrionales bacterium]